MRDAGYGSEEWPIEGLEAVELCPVCGASSRRQLFADLEDRVFRVAPGKWSLSKCRLCRTAWLDPRPKDDFLPLAYRRYFTHEVGSERVIIRRLGVVRRALHDVVNGYLAMKYGVHRNHASAGWLLYLVPPLRAVCDAMCRHLPHPAHGGKLLDVGCGNGQFLSLAREMGWIAEGVDFDPDAVRQARSLGFSVSEGGIDALAEQGCAYDIVTSSHVLEHVANPIQHLRAVYSVLKPGGRLWLQTPNLKSIGARWFGRNWRGLEPPRHLVLFNTQSLRSCLREAGFIDIRTKADAGQAFIVFRASEAIRLDSEVKNSSNNKDHLLREIIAEAIEWFWPYSREFLTVMCRKPKA